MSATPRIYDLEYINYEIEDSNENDSDDNSSNEDNEDEDYKSNNIINLGEITYSMNFTTAIEQKYITDYRKVIHVYTLFQGRRFAEYDGLNFIPKPNTTRDLDAIHNLMKDEGFIFT